MLAPGWLVARALGQRSGSATLVWATAAVFVAWAVVFVVHGSIWLAVGVLAAIAGSRRSEAAAGAACPPTARCGKASCCSSA